MSAGRRITSRPMLDPRIYRTGLIVVGAGAGRPGVLARQPAGRADADAGAGRLQRRRTRTPTMRRPAPSRIPTAARARRATTRSPTTVARDAAASTASRLQRAPFQAQTVDGTRTLENVVGDAGRDSQSGSIVIVAHRDALGPAPGGELSGTATLMELARVLEGETLHRTVVLASTSGTARARRARSGSRAALRAAGRRRDRARRPGQRATCTQPSSCRGQTRQPVAPPMLRNTVAAALAQQTALSTGGHRPGRPVRASGVPAHAGEQAPVRRARASGGAALALRRARPGGRRAGHEPGAAHRVRAAPCCRRSPRWTAARRPARRRPMCCSAARSCPAGRSRCSSWRCCSRCC